MCVYHYVIPKRSSRNRMFAEAESPYIAFVFPVAALSTGKYGAVSASMAFFATACRNSDQSVVPRLVTNMKKL